MVFAAPVPPSAGGAPRRVRAACPTQADHAPDVRAARSAGCTSAPSAHTGDTSRARTSVDSESARSKGARGSRRRRTVPRGSWLWLQPRDRLVADHVRQGEPNRGPSLSEKHDRLCVHLDGGYVLYIDGL